MTLIRKTSNVVSLGKASRKTVSGTSSATQAPSPFAISPPDPLKSITERKSRSLSEWERLALLQRALGSFAEEARKKLPSEVRSVEEKVRKKMIQEGFAKEVASEAGDETVSAILTTRSKTVV